MTQSPAPEVTPARNYDWAVVPYSLQVHWLAPREGQPRQVMIAVTTYDDAPLARLLDARELGPLPEALHQLLQDLQASLAIRALHYEQRLRQQGKGRPPQSTAAPSRPRSTTDAEGLTQTQINLF
ncbi:hypothetical protein [Leptolyngbya sp. PCC 6406]|uniref:hypothetical protein n=1 Tax=Leptolyngbya sp. PCC 6406 TaxID=1173264 RepID=UPI0002ACD6CA|nr:hypothetical protein [Leptolyngbya sp. PCC 6406]